MFNVDLTSVEHHPVITELVDVLCSKTQNLDRGFFQAEVAHFLCLMASSMRATINTGEVMGRVPMNMYTLLLATSGFGKGLTMGILEEEVIGRFRKRFMNDTFPIISEANYHTLATERAVRSGEPVDDELAKVVAESNRAGAYPFTFDSATTPAVKQLRGKLLLTTIGAINLVVDEIGLNLSNSTEVLTTFLELYDRGRLKPKLTKNTAENIRNEDADGITPANMLLFGTPAKLLDNGQTEDQFYMMLDNGYARRCLFGYGREVPPEEKPSVEEFFDLLSQNTNSQILQRWADVFYDLADPAFFGWEVTLPRPAGLLLIGYKLACEAKAFEMPEHEQIRKTELKHRYAKAIRLAGAFAFVDMTTEIGEDHMLAAIKLVEESGESFQMILNRDKPYVKLAKFIANEGKAVNHVDLHEALPFYKTGKAARDEMMTMAVAWGYPRHIVITKSFVDGIEFFKGEKLKETDLDNVRVSYSDHYAYNYQNETVPFNQLHVLTQQNGYNWCSHHFKQGHRCKENAEPGFDLLVLDVDGTCPLSVAQELLKDFTYLMYTTKRHQTEDHGDRYRIILPMNYFLKLDDKDYKTFMEGVVGWMPFQVDEEANQRERKWSTYNGECFYNEGQQLFDCLPFIPRTSRNDEYQNQNKELRDLNNLERWFAQRMVEGARNNHMLRFAMILYEGGMTYAEARQTVLDFNNKLSDPLSVEELDKSVFITLAKKYVEPA